MEILSKLEGIWPVMPTPYFENGEVDYVAVKKLVEWYVSAGCNGVLVSGSGGEFPYILPEERAAMAANAAEAAAGRVPVMCGLGPMGTKAASKQAREAISAGADFILAAMPTYHPVALKDAVDHYRSIAEVSEGRLLYYHFPQTTRFDPGPEGVAAICDVKGVVGTKMSRPNLREMRKSLDKTAARPFALFTGTILLMEETLDMGGAGVIGILPSVFPEESVAWYKALRSGDRVAAKAASKKVKSAISLLAGFWAPPYLQRMGIWAVSRLPFAVPVGNISTHAAVKEALRLKGFEIRPDARSPLPGLTDNVAAKVAGLMEKMKIA